MGHFMPQCLQVLVFWHDTLTLFEDGLLVEGWSWNQSTHQRFPDNSIRCRRPLHSNSWAETRPLKCNRLPGFWWTSRRPSFFLFLWGARRTLQLGETFIQRQISTRFWFLRLAPGCLIPPRCTVPGTSTGLVACLPMGNHNKVTWKSPVYRWGEQSKPNISMVQFELVE